MKATAYQNSGGGLALGGATWASRLCMLYLCPYSAGGVNSFTPPAPRSTGWRVPRLLDPRPAHRASRQRPELPGQPALFHRVSGHRPDRAHRRHWTSVTIDTVGGLIHGSPGDNYGGWSAYSNSYAAIVAGWYLVICEVYAAVPSLTTGYCRAGIKIPTSGGIAPVHQPGLYQTVFFPLTSPGPCRARRRSAATTSHAGETVQPVALAQNWSGGTWTTASAAGTRSQFTSVAERSEPGVGRFAYRAHRRCLRSHRLGRTSRMAPPSRHFRVPG